MKMQIEGLYSLQTLAKAKKNCFSLNNNEMFLFARSNFNGKMASNPRMIVHNYKVRLKFCSFSVE